MLVVLLGLLGSCSTAEALATAPIGWWDTTAEVGVALLEDLLGILVLIGIPLW